MLQPASISSTFLSPPDWHDVQYDSLFHDVHISTSVLSFNNNVLVLTNGIKAAMGHRVMTPSPGAICCY